MKPTIVIAGLLMAVCAAAFASPPPQTCFILPDDSLRPPPADRATVPLCTPDDTTRTAAYGGAVWGEHDLSGTPGVMAWEVRPAGGFDDFLTAQGYRRLPSPQP